MNHADAISRLEEYFDGTLSPEAHREIEAHLAGCPRCRDELSSLGALLDTVAEMREKRVEPSRDLWPEIAARIAIGPRGDAAREDARPPDGARRVEADVTDRVRPRAGARRIPFPWLAGAVGLAAAAVLLLFVLPGPHPRQANVGETGRTAGGGTATVAPSVDHDSGSRPAEAATVPASTAAAPSNGGGDTMTRELAMLDAQVRSSRESVRREGIAGVADTAAVAPAWRIFDQSLAVLDQAIKDSRAALEREPDNSVLQKSLLAAYQKQLELIRWANRVVRQG